MGKFLNFLILVQNLGELLNFFKGPYFQKTEDPTQTGSEKLRKNSAKYKEKSKIFYPIAQVLRWVSFAKKMGGGTNLEASTLREKSLKLKALP